MTPSHKTYTCQNNFFLQILNVKCLPNNPPNSIPFHGQNVPAAPNSWTGQPAQTVLQGMTNIFDAMNPNPSHNPYVNNDDNQQNIKYDQQYSTPQPYNSPHYNNYNQQYFMSQPYNAQPHNYKQQSPVSQPYNAPLYNYEQQHPEPSTYNAPQVIQKNQNQHSKEPQLYNLHPPSQSSGPTNSQSFGILGPSLKEYQEQLPSSINQPIEILPAFGQPINNAKNQENIQQSSTQIPPIPNQSQLSQMASNLSNPIVKESSKSNGYNIDIKEAESPDFGKPNINAKNQNIIQQSSPPIPPIPNQSPLSQMASNLSNPIVKESSKSNGYNIDISEAESPDFGKPNINAKNQNIIQQSSPPIPPIPNQSQLSQMTTNLSKPIVKESFTPNGYNIEIKEEAPDFGQPINNAKNQENVQQSPPPISSLPNQFQLSKPIVKESFTPNGYDIENKKEAPDFGQPTNNGNYPENIQQSPPPISSLPNQFQLSKPMAKESFTPNEYDIEIKEEAPDFGQPINNAKNQENVQQSPPPISSILNHFQLSKPIAKESFTPNGYDIENKKEAPDFDQPINNGNYPENIQQSPPPISSLPNQFQLSKPMAKESFTPNEYDIENKKEAPDFGQPTNNGNYPENIQQSPPPISSLPNQFQLSKPMAKESFTPNEYDIEIKEEAPDFGQPINNAKNQENVQQSPPPISSLPNQFQLSKPMAKESFTPNEYDIENKKEAPDFGQPTNNGNYPENIQQSPPPISSLPNQFQLSKPMAKESFTPNEYDIEIKEEAPDFGQPINNAKNQENVQQSPPPISSILNHFQLSKPIAKESFTPNGYDIENKKEAPDFGQPINNGNYPENIQQSLPPISSLPNQFQLSKPMAKESFTPNEYDIENKKEAPDFGQPINNGNYPENIQQSPPPISSLPNQFQLSKPMAKESFTPNEYDIENKKEAPDFGQPINNGNYPENIQQSPPPISSLPNQFQLSKPMAKESFTPNEYDIENKKEAPDFGQPINNGNYPENIQQSPPPISSLPNQFQLSKPMAKESFTPNEYDIEIKEEAPDFGQPINNGKNQENVQQSSPPNEYDTEIKGVVPDFDPVIYNAENQGNKPSSAPDFPPNQSKISPIPSQSSSKLTPNENTMQIKNDNMSLNSLLGLPDGQSEPLINDFAQNEDVLIDNSQTDIQLFLNSENNQDDFQLVVNDMPPQLPMNVQAANAIIDSQSNDLISNMDLNNDTENLQNTSNEDSSSENVEDTELNEESKLKKAMSESLVVALDDTDTENDELYTLGNLVFDVPPSELDRLSNYDTSFIVDTENPKNVKEDNAKITVYANPNDVHILQLSPKQSSTNDNSYLINNNLLNTPSTEMPLWYSSFPNGADYVQHFNSNTNKQKSNSFFNFNQNPAYNQIPMNLENSNYFNQQAAVDQNQMTSKIQSPGLSLDDNQPSSMDSSGSIYKKVDLKNLTPNSSNSWSLLKKDYTKNLQPNQNDRYTSGDGTTRTSFFGTPLSSYQNSNQEILNLPSNDMFVQNMISVISNSVQAPLDGTKAIFDITSANFPRSSVSHIIRLTHAIVRSVMLNLRQTLNTFMKILYGHRVKRDFNPFEVLHNLPGALVNKYSLQSTAAPTTKYINSPYYNQPTIRQANKRQQIIL
ncbi:uncharacterized protein DDB_G0283357-like isoform X1 [Aphis gossypii]|uniref:uncharacterized protein DDB_G0283357-like isoform X1 n=1 Tax=Aphis gossypii TaxID=80765 RepID=UPI002159A7D1|nr:uncharacterized protein DDB_G0283357-like isoform X1 [Aphis gossypii]XP_050066163.1 uncharacterized protein DDB_G0283357-like isoform X1 [Aphis gossypii]